MTSRWAKMLRKCVIGLTLVMAVGAFFPDTAHLSIDSIEHDAAGHTHDDGASDRVAGVDDLASKHCHNGVSCTGAIATRNQLSPTTISHQINQAFVQGGVTDTSPMLWRDPPVPIEIA